MKNSDPKTIHLKDYKPLDYTISECFLTVELGEAKTIVRSELKVQRSPNSQSKNKLVLHGHSQELESVELNGQKIEVHSTEEGIELSVPEVEEFQLLVTTWFNPAENKALEGLYLSGNIYCTQCEPEGFRRITYFLDRPDNMCRFKTKVIANKEACPVLLSNGNPIESGELENGRHFVTWEDPFPKPSYLYALVAGDLGQIQDQYQTLSGRKVDLRIYCDKGNENKCWHAMESLKKSMKWDEERFGLEYDLDIYMIVAVDSFNMGAMENKGLNVFNSAYVLANPETATDRNFSSIESVIGHEYFHNWTGNRVTCRDWFQLTLKEGLTVFRDQEFSSDLNSRHVKRIEDVEVLRSHQYPEDAGPNAHPIKPASYMQINNFYTATVYEKGAEVIRMIHTLLGEQGFRKGMDRYFELFDGQAVTTEDFVRAMSEANNNYDFSQFLKWYSQAGTPEITVESHYDESTQTFELSLEQKTPATPGQPKKDPLHIPFRIGLIDSQGRDMSLELLERRDQPQLNDNLLHLKENKEVFKFKLGEKPHLSLNRGFSSPVNVTPFQSEEELAFLMNHDSDGFQRFQACQNLGQKIFFKTLKGWQDQQTFTLEETYKKTYGRLITTELDPEFHALCLGFPSETILHQPQKIIDFKNTYEVRKRILGDLASSFSADFQNLYHRYMGNKEYLVDAESMGKRSLKNKALSMLVLADSPTSYDLCYEQYQQANNMTDRLAAFVLLVHTQNDHREKVIQDFYDKWKHETLVMQKWLAVLASAPFDETHDKILELEKDAIYDVKVPNLMRSLVGSFARTPVLFHHESGRGYQYIADKVLEVDKFNPQMAARLGGCFEHYSRVSENLKAKMKAQLERIIQTPKLSSNTFEIVSKTLKV